MTKLIFAISALLLAIFTIAGIYFSNISSTNRTGSRALKGLPANTAMVIEFNNEKTFYEIFENYEIFDAIFGEKQSKELVYIKENFLDKNLKDLAYGQNIFLVPFRKKDSLQCLWLLPLKSENELNGSIFGSGNLAISNQKRRNFSFFLKDLEKTLYVHLEDNIIAASFTKSIVENYYEKKEAKISDRFIDEINSGITKNPNSPVNIFLENKMTSAFFDSFFKKPVNDDISLIMPQQGFMIFNMNYKSDALIFSGTSTTDTSAKTYLNIFATQKPVKNTIDLIATESTSSYINFGISDRKVFDEKLKNLLSERKEYQKLSNQVSSNLKQVGGNIENDLKQYMGNEFTVLKLANSENIGILKVNNGEKVKFLLEPVSRDYSDNIRRLKISNYLYLNYGDPFKKFTLPFYTIVDNYFICGNNPSAVRQYLNEYTSGRFLFKTKKNIQFDQLVSDHSSITAFIHLSNSRYLLSTKARPYLKNLFRNDNYGLEDFYGISYQVNFAGGHFISNFYAGYKISEQDSVINQATE